MTPFDRAFSIVTEYEAAGETSAARMLLLTRIEDIAAAAWRARQAAEAERLRLLQDFCVTDLDGHLDPHTMEEDEAAIVDEWAQVVAALDAVLVGDNDAPA
ncbi:hypothetical protein [Xanthobacter sp. YC-JY1]|uniref:hypothetical protein n=1 Tax=Xanthobacter sp. YC-JY1 TaxID=2419844 RepID=UPI001F411361|nr:hypothetical protein [Xanthobacter sp. YC-JY1]UJX46608.1 hypothetical protein D7006_19145 [Xanthobacter sp. YC-JY1]